MTRHHHRRRSSGCGALAAYFLVLTAASMIGMWAVWTLLIVGSVAVIAGRR